MPILPRENTTVAQAAGVTAPAARHFTMRNSFDHPRCPDGPESYSPSY